MGIIGEENYTKDKYGVIINECNYKGEMWYVPEIWDLISRSLRTERIKYEGETYYIFYPDKQEMIKYDLKEEDGVYALALHEVAAGTVYAQILDIGGYQTMKKGIENKSDISS